ncbi:MAG: DUF983 domain-containing protein [Bacteroidota bacterium]
MPKSKSLLSSIFNMTCPRCREGDLFETSSYSFDRPFDMPDHCPHCGQSYLPEPGFYYGAMFVSYIISAWGILLFMMFMHWIIGWSLTTCVVVVLIISAINFVWFFRFSRSVWIHIIVKYRPEAAKQ